MGASVQFNILPPSHGWTDTDMVPAQRLPSQGAMVPEQIDKPFVQSSIPPCLLVFTTSQPVQGSRDSNE